MLADCNNLDQYLDAYGGLLAKQTEKSFLPLHVPGRDPVVRLDLARPLFPAQLHAVTGVVRGLERQKSVILCAEVGSGKTGMGAAAIHAIHAHAAGNDYRCLVMAPDHLIDKWAREIKTILPDVKVFVIDNWRILTKLRRHKPPAGQSFWLVGRNKAKLGPEWRAAVLPHRDGDVLRCPACGQVIHIGQSVADMKQLSRVKRTCQEEVMRRRRRDGKDLVDVCGTPLWQNTHKLDRYAPADYIHKRLKGYFQYLIADELHEYKGETTAQGQALGSLAAACGKMLGLTGTLIGGYANHVRPLLFRLSPQSLVAEGFDWANSTAFVREYGRIETTITEKSGGDGESNRQSRGSKPTKRENPRPGIMPTLYGRHLIGNTVFLSLEEVAAGLPDLLETAIPVNLPPEMSGYKEIEKKLREAMTLLLRKGDRQLLGRMLNVLLCWPDYPYDWKTIGYYDKAFAGDDGGVFVPVVTPPNLEDKVWPKEQKLIDMVLAEKAAGRQCWVYVQYTTKRPVGDRLVKLLQAAGLRAKMLKSSVPLRTRESWIAKQAPGLDVIVSHPQLVETGLDLFCKRGTYNFPTLLFYETGYRLFTLRQASRRAWRIAQRLNCKVHYLYYADTMQQKAMELMGKKLHASLALEGKFSTEGLAAMAADDSSVEMELAKSLSKKMDPSAMRQWERITQHTSPAAPTRVVFPDVAAELRAAFGPTAPAKATYQWPDIAAQLRAAFEPTTTPKETA